MLQKVSFYRLKGYLLCFVRLPSGSGASYMRMPDGLVRMFQARANLSDIP